VSRCDGPDSVTEMRSFARLYRSQSIVRVRWSHYEADHRFGMCFRMAHNKNHELHWIPASPALQDFLKPIRQTSPCVTTAKLIFSESDVAGNKATGQLTSERRKKPFQLARVQ
jgi:hypothetical protein